MSAHSEIGASSMYRWGNCPGSVKFCHDIPSVTSHYAAEGTKAHEVAAYYLLHQDWPNNIDIDKEMMDAVSVYTNEVLGEKRLLDFSINGNLFLIEHGFKLSEIDENAFGTADCVIFNAKTKHLTVYDYKHGAGISVEVESNEQLMYYALGVLLSTKVRPRTIELKIVQPRCDHIDGVIRSYNFQTIEILDFMHDLEQAIWRTKQKDAPLFSGKWCRFCPGAGICPELAKNANDIARDMFKPVIVTDEEKLKGLEPLYDPLMLSKTLDRLDELEAFVSRVREFAYSEAMRGKEIPGYKVVQKRSTRRWKVNSGVDKFLNKILDQDLIKDCYSVPELKSPAQIEKIVGKDNKNSLTEFIVAESSGYKLAHESEPGEPIFLDPKNLFKELT